MLPNALTSSNRKGAMQDAIEARVQAEQDCADLQSHAASLSQQVQQLLSQQESWEQERKLPESLQAHLVQLQEQVRPACN